MSSAILSQSERDLQTAVIDLARRLRWRVAHFHDSRRQVKPGVLVGDKDASGFPDLVLVRASRLIVAELKRENGRLSPAQCDWLESLKATVAEVYLWRPSDWASIEGILR